MSFTVYPALDVREGRVVRLRQGDYERETRYAADPFELACEYQAQGAGWLHLVDLDAARSGGYSLFPLLRRLREETTLRVQTGGGVRREADVACLLAAGASRVVIGSLAVAEPALVAGWLARFGEERLTLAFDTRADAAGDWSLPVHGWTRDSGRSLGPLLDVYAASGLRHVLCTDIERDGMLAGPNLALYAWLRARAPDLRVQASGGVRDAADVAAARAAGCDGVVLGRALLEGRLDLPAALQAASC
jgi:phosphoribosylformimino-5-aminoimidazole carboxamide ribotide isomerase